MTWIEKHVGLILLIFLCIFAIEGAIWCWHMPEDFRKKIIPNINRILIFNEELLEYYDESMNRCFKENFNEHTHRYYDGKIREPYEK